MGVGMSGSDGVRIFGSQKFSKDEDFPHQSPTLLHNRVCQMGTSPSCGVSFLGRPGFCSGGEAVKRIFCRDWRGKMHCQSDKQSLCHGTAMRM